MPPARYSYNAWSIQSQATAYHTTAASLSSMPATPTFENSLSTGLSASLAQSFTHIQSIARRQAAYHEGIASDLERKVLEGFIRWANVHESRVRVTSEEVLGYVPRPFEERSNGKAKGEGSLVGDYGRLALEVAKVGLQSSSSTVFAYRLIGYDGVCRPNSSAKRISPKLITRTILRKSESSSRLALLSFEY